MSSAGVRSARIDAVSARSCALDSKLRENRIDAAGQRMQQSRAVGVGKRQAFDAQDDRAACRLEFAQGDAPSSGLAGGSRFAQQRLHLPHGFAQADEHGARHDRVADVQLAHARQRATGCTLK